MRKFLNIFAGLIGVLMLSGTAMAAPQLLGGERIELSTGKAASDDVYAGGERIVINDDVRGDLIVGGNMVEINGNVSGDLIVAGGTITLKGRVGDDLRVAGGQITIYSEIGDDLLLGGGNVILTDQSRVGGDILAGSGELLMYGQVAGNVKAGFGKARIKGQIGGNADLYYGDGELTVAEGGRIKGALRYYASSEDTSLADVAGSVEYHKWTKGGDMPWGIGILAPAVLLGNSIWHFLGLLILGGLFILLMPKYLPNLLKRTKKELLTTLWRGLSWAVLVPVAIIILVMTVIGLPVAGLLGLVYLLTMVIGRVAGAALIGSLILRQEMKTPADQWRVLALGALIYTLLGWVPVFGWIAKLIFFLFGLGAVWYQAYTVIRPTK